MARPDYFLLIDGHALIYRAYHAFPALSTKTGVLVNAVFGFTRHVLTAIRDYEPTYIAVALDHPKPTFRHADFVDYKANRVSMPDDLRPQIEIIKQVVKTLNIPQFELEGYEADDLIGTLSCRIADLREKTSEDKLMTVIVTGDRDSFQLVNDTTHAWLPGRGKGQDDREYGRDEVKQRMGVYPEQIVDLKALMGDASDNIPGVKGVGEKTAVRLMTTFGSLEKVYAAVDRWQAGERGELAEVLKDSLVTKLVDDKANALLSQQLATINCAVPIELDLDSCRVSGYDKHAAAELFEELDFRSLVKLLPADEFELGIQSALF
jgi:DNA polymerase-1